MQDMMVQDMMVLFVFAFVLVIGAGFYMLWDFSKVPADTTRTMHGVSLILVSALMISIIYLVGTSRGGKTVLQLVWSEARNGDGSARIALLMLIFLIVLIVAYGLLGAFHLTRRTKT